MRTRGQTGTGTGVHIEQARADGDINRSAHGGHEAGQGHQQGFTLRTRGRTGTSTEMHTEDARSDRDTIEMYTEDARPDKDINRNAHGGRDAGQRHQQ